MAKDGQRWSFQKEAFVKGGKARGEDSDDKLMFCVTYFLRLYQTASIRTAPNINPKRTGSATTTAQFFLSTTQWAVSS